MTLKHKGLGVAGVILVGVASGVLVGRHSAAVGLLALVVVGVLAVVATTQLLIGRFDDPEAVLLVCRWALASLGVHLAVGLIVVNSGALTSFLGPDAITYDLLATQIAAHWSHGAAMPSLPGGKEGYFYVLAGIYWIFGHSTWAGVALNATLAALLAPVVTDTTWRLFGRPAARYATAIVVVVPGMVLWTSQLLKEAAFVFLVAVAANCAVRLAHRYSAGPLVVLAVVLPVLLTFRSQLGLAVGAGIFAGIVLGRGEVVGGLVGGFLVAVLAAGVVSLGVGSSGYDTAVSSNLKQANAVRQGLAVAASGYQSQTDVSTTSRAVTFLPLGLVTVAFGPFPWQLQGTRQLVAIPDILVWWVLAAAFWWGQRAARQLGRQWLVLFMPSVAVAAVLALIIGNFGIVVRERMQVLVLLAPIMALGLAERRASREAEAIDDARPGPGVVTATQRPTLR
ncbi:MAG: hypothetical protein ACR2MB_03915 [Acidimicrobiales bacterium]